MLKQIRDFIYTKRANHLIKSVPRNRMFVNYASAKNILLLFESNYSEKNPGTKRIIEQMTADGKKVTALGYVEKKQVSSPVYPEFRIMHPGDLDLFHKPKDSVIQHILEQEFDLLIDITNRKWLALAYVVLYAQAKCKAGMKKDSIDLYDFAVDIEGYLTENEMQAEDLTFAFLYDQIIFYLKSIQTTDY